MDHYSVWVGGLKGVVQERDLTEKFTPFGNIMHVFIPRDQETKKSQHYGFVIFNKKDEAETAARLANGTTIHGGAIIARGPDEQIRRGHSGKYNGKIGYVPSNVNDKRKYTDCIHFVNSICNNGRNCPYRHSDVARSPSVLVCLQWKNNNCTDIYCQEKHPGPKHHYLANGNNDPVKPLYSLSINDQGDDLIKLATYNEFDSIKRKFKEDWAVAKGVVPDVKAVFIITNEILRRKWETYKQSLSFLHQQVEQHYHGTKLLCDITSNEDLCCSYDCSTCRIVTSGFSSLKIGSNIARFQRFGRGFYLAPNSSKCHDYTEGAYEFRAVLLCDVCPGKKWTMTVNDTSLNGPPTGYDSIHGKTGASLNYEEIVLPSPDAILPKHIIVYKKDGIHKLI